MLEKEMSPGIKDYFVNLGFEVKGEVNDCDLVAVKDEFIVIVEMKLRLNLDVILQGVDRQQMKRVKGVP